uniref:ELMO domain-containing protein n=1 Tax=Strigamia maritima TaxID=126957 RepID=T1J0J3_STRMM
MQVIVNIVWSYFLWFVRPLYKWFLHKTTRLSQLQRICYGNVFGAGRSLRIEDCLSKSRTSGIIAMVTHLNKLSDEGKFHGKEAEYLVQNAVAGITIIKKIDCRLHMQFLRSMDVCFHQILGFRQLVYEIETIRKIPYTAENPSHENKLIHLWNLLQPDTPLTSRVTKQWGDIGFQGDDPKTDFRGMGMLGLENLLKVQ